jgi:tRNA modification GTPase
MPRSYFDSDTPIAAAATPPGESALAVVRAFGPDSLRLASLCFSRPRALMKAPAKTLVHGDLVDSETGEAIDEVLAAVYRAPGGPIGEDGVEFFCHGSPAVIRRALEALSAVGFARALPGEFTFRAFLRGKTDLVRAEAVQELVRAASDGARASALVRLEGTLSRRIGRIRAGLLELFAETEARLDFDEEDGAPEGSLDPSRLAAIRTEIESLAASYSVGRLYESGALVVIAGRPNAGKSSLFNLVLREERSIVSSESGTTRDWIEAGVELGGLPLRLVDTAGLREATSGAEIEGVARSRRLAAEAAVVVYVVDGTVGLDAEDKAFLGARSDAVRVWNKADDPRCLPVPNSFISVSAIEGRGLSGLLAALEEAVSSVFGRGGAEAACDAGAAARRDSCVASARQKNLLDRAAVSLAQAESALRSGETLDALSLRIREAADALGEITGEVASDDILDSIFSRFCLGK